MSIAVISTSINSEPDAYHAWAGVGDLYVAGDTNSPKSLRDYVNEIGGVYLDGNDQMQWSCSEIIGWRNIQRRNLALLAALEAGGYDYYVTVDDDNFPSVSPAEFRAALEVPFGQRPGMRARPDRDGGLWFNPGTIALPTYRQRGLPSRYFSEFDYRLSSADHPDVQVGVLQCQILGDPDCDAVQRLVRPVNVRDYAYDLYVEPGTYAPFNSQATVWPAEFAPLMAVLPGCQRYDDIYASVIATRILHEVNHVVYFGTPYVRQLRNAHDIGKDLAAELDGMNAIQAFAEFVDGLELDDTDDIIEHYREITYQLNAAGFLPDQAYEFTKAYLEDLAGTNWKN
jgi:hypothetical protein